MNYYIKLAEIQEQIDEVKDSLEDMRFTDVEYAATCIHLNKLRVRKNEWIDYMISNLKMQKEDVR